MYEKDVMILEWATHSYLFIEKTGLMGDFLDFLIEEQYKDKDPITKAVIMAFHEDFAEYVDDKDNRGAFFDEKMKDIDFSSMKPKKRERVLMEFAKEYVEKKKSE